MRYRFLIASILCFAIAISAAFAIGQEIPDVTVKGVIRGVHVEGKWIVGSVSIMDNTTYATPVQIGARGWRAPFGKTKAETLANCKAAIKEALKGVGKQYLRDANLPAPIAEHLEGFNDRALDYNYPSEELVMGNEAPLPTGEGDYGPL